MKTNQTFSILFWIKKSRLKNNLAPISVRITIDGKRAEISLQRSIEPAKWDAKAGKVKGSSEEVRTLNAYINLIKGNLEKHYNKMFATEQRITAQTFKNSYLGISEKQKTLCEVFEYHNQMMYERIDIEFSQTTYKKYKVTFHKLKEFLQTVYKCNDIALSDLKYRFITDFEHFMKVKQNLRHNSTVKYLINLKKIIKIAVSNEWLVKDPFSSFKCSVHEVIRECLTQEELDLLTHKEFKVSRLDEIRDIFLFSCYTGYSYADVIKFTPDHVVIWMDGEKWIVTQRKKTENKSNVPLLPVALQIIEKYKHHPAAINTGTLFPRKSNQKINAYLKEIADICGIKKNLTFHIARHTFATTIALSNGVSIETVKSMLGHKNISTTQIYAKVVDKKVSEEMSSLKEKLSDKSLTRIAK